MATYHTTTTINGDAVEFLCEPQETLLDVLRDRLGLIGSKEGLGHLPVAVINPGDVALIPTPG